MEELIIAIIKKSNPAMIDDVNVDLLETGLIDSFEIMNIVMDIEDAFEIEIDPELIVAESFRTVTAIAELIKSIKE